MPTTLNLKGRKGNTNHLSLMEQKRRRLKEEQDSLKAFSPTAENLKRQQEALTNALLIRQPTPETKKERLRRIKEQEKMNKDLNLQRQKQMELDAKLKSQFNVQSKGFFFPYGDVRIKKASGMGKGKEKEKRKQRPAR